MTITDNFLRCFICPSESRASFLVCRRFLAVNGTFLKGPFKLTLLLVVGIDAKGHNLILAWAVVESENRASWEYFFRYLRRAILEISEASERYVLISDRDKGLLEADTVLGPEILRAICCKHLCVNFSAVYGRSLEAFFWKAARARTPTAFDGALERLAAVKPDATEYLRNSVSERSFSILY